MSSRADELYEFCNNIEYVTIYNKEIDIITIQQYNNNEYIDNILFLADQYKSGKLNQYIGKYIYVWNKSEISTKCFNDIIDAMIDIQTNRIPYNCIIEMVRMTFTEEFEI